MTNFDGVLKQVGELGRAQIFYYILVGICGIPVGMQNLSSVFVAGAQNFWCWSTSFNVSVGPPANNETCASYNPATVSANGSITDYKSWQKDSYSNLMNGTASCAVLHFDTSQYTSTILSQFSLVCNRSFLVSLTTTVYMSGVLVGCTLFGIVSDRIGRIKALLISAFLMVVFAIFAALVPNFPIYVICRFIVGGCAIGCFTTAFVIAMEIIGPKYRMVTGIMMQQWFAIGFMSLTTIAFFVRNHIVLQLVMSVPAFLLLSYYWILPESPRWLIVNGRSQEAVDVVRKIARLNRKPVPEESELNASLRQKTSSVVHHGNGLDLLRMPNLRKRSLNIFFNWFVNAFVFYGLSLGVGSLGGNVYLNALLSGLVEVPAYVLCSLILDRVGRIKPLTVFLIVGGLSCLSCTVIFGNDDLKWLLVTLSMVGKFAISASFAIIYVYTAEVFPTVVRNLAVGVSSTCARMGAIVAPQVALTETLWAPFPFLIFGAFPLMAGLLCLLLPETLHQELPETILDGENFGTKNQRRTNAVDGELQPMGA